MSLATHATDRSMMGSPPQVVESMTVIQSTGSMRPEEAGPGESSGEEGRYEIEEEEMFETYGNKSGTGGTDDSGYDNIDFRVMPQSDEEEEEEDGDAEVDPCSSVESIPKKHHIHKCTPQGPWWAMPQYGFKPEDVFTIKIINTVSFNYTRLRVCWFHNGMSTSFLVRFLVVRVFLGVFVHR